ncbi:Protein of unknown function DUF1223 [Nitrobacter winogradskyi Nb-255]|uniref:DUF1223 domain-containing protein n=2 Tax=Nitrobacter winogradskyi TaxID=913 RepID=Q3SVV0_NITWN|nr:Protein of unknown function DUF1223 [Nitrobacter winogradskyi Nb-255]
MPASRILKVCFSFMPQAPRRAAVSVILMMSRGGLTRLSGALGVCALVALSRAALAEPRAVVELFTSQGCSSCPAADEILGDLSKDPSIVALSMPIDYWDYLGWKDTLADNRFTARQKAYSQMRGDRDVYTPQVIVNGSAHVIGSDRGAIERAVRDTQQSQDVMSVPVSMSVSGRQLNVSVASANGKHLSGRGEIWVCAVSRAVPIAIGRGENSGREVTYHNVVRNWLKVGDWTGKAGTWAVPIENIAHNGVDAAVVYVQDGNRERPGRMLGAAYTLLH